MNQAGKQVERSGFVGADEKIRRTVTYEGKEVPVYARECPRNVARLRMIAALYGDAGLPVVPVIPDNSNPESFCTLDVTADGSRVFGKSTLGILTIESFGARKWKPTTRDTSLDARFIEVYTEEREKIQSEVIRNMERANYSNVLLPVDDSFELRVQPDGNWQLIILDIEQGGQLDDPEFLEYNEVKKAIAFHFGIRPSEVVDKVQGLTEPEKKELIEAINKKSADECIEILEDIHEDLLKIQSNT